MASDLIHVILTNRHAWFLCSPAVQEKLKAVFSYSIPGAEYSEMFKSGGWDGKRSMFSRGRVGAGLFLGMWKELHAVGFRFVVKDERVAPAFKPFPDSPDLRPYQKQAVEAMIRAARTGGLVIAATGVGKTRMVSELLRRLDGSGVFICDELALLEQSRRELHKVIGENIGVVGRGEFHPNRVTVATVQTLNMHRRKPEFVKWFTSVDVLVIDEIHVALNRRSIDVVRMVKPKAVFGLTATLEMHKQHVRMEAMALAGPVIFNYTIQTGVADGYLTQGKVCRVLFDDPTPKGWTGSPEADYRQRITFNRARNECVASLAREGVRLGHRVIVLVERIAHLKILSRMLEDVNHRMLYGAYGHQDRFAAKEAMDAGTLSLILASRIFAKGVDIRRVSVIIDAAGMPSRNGVIQKFGRGVRIVSGKTDLLFVDIADRGNRFEGAAHARMNALRELHVEIRDAVWRGRPEEIYSI